MTADAVGGVWTYALELARALASANVHVDLAVMGPGPSAAQRADVAALSNVTLHARPYRLEWMDDPWADVEAAGDWLLSIARATTPDVVHLNGYAHGPLPWNAPVVVVAHSCVLSWWRAVKGQDAPATWDRYHEVVAAGIHAADVVVAPTQVMLDEVARWYGRPAATRVVPNGRDAAAFPPGAKEPIVLTFGRLWDEAKNVAGVVRAAGELSCPVCVAGETTPPNGVAANVAQDGAVRWLGRLDAPDVSRWLARSAVYALPARYEPFGLSALEAALAGCALVLGDIPSLREVWGGAALYVDPDSPAELARALRTLTHDTSACARNALACRARALTYTPARMAAEYLATYDLAASLARAEVACAS